MKQNKIDCQKCTVVLLSIVILEVGFNAVPAATTGPNACVSHAALFEIKQ